jgi:hypothetical protein
MRIQTPVVMPRAEATLRVRSGRGLAPGAGFARS